MAIKLEWYKKSDKTTTDITELVTKASWTGANTQTSRSLSFSIVSNYYDKNFNAPKINGGDIIYFYDGSSLKFVGRVFNTEKKSEIGTVDVTAYDYMYNLTKSTGTYKFTKKTPEYIAKSVAKSVGVSVGSMPKTKHSIKKYIPSDMSPYNIILKAFQMVEKYTKKKYMLQMNGTKLEVVERGTVATNLIFSSDSHITGAQYSEDATGVINRVNVYNSKGTKIGQASSSGDISKYGVLQGSINVDKGKGTTEAKNAITGITKNASVTCIGDWACVAGRAINIEDAASGLVGKYWIKNDTHDFENNTHMMTLDLEFSNNEETIDYSQINNNASKTTNADGSVTKTKKKTYKAIFTGYAPTGKKTANGEKTVPKSHTCAAPKSIAFNTKIIPKGTKTSIDNVTYRVNDRGGAIKVDKKGYYHIDILFKNKSEAKKFGRRTGKIEAIKKVTVKTASESKGSSAFGQKLVNKALSKRGCKYVWGASGPNTFDCSGLVWWACKQCGVNFARTNTKGLSKKWKGVSYANMKPGDIILFSSNGAYSGIHHTGIYIGNGKMVHAPHTGSTVRVQSITSGYYRKQWYTARRIK
jgi:cell wall-associated NlpC family hydrolase